MKVRRYYEEPLEKKTASPNSSFYGRHHDESITLKPEVSAHVHAPISDSYGASESLNAWKTPDKPKSERCK